MAMALAEGQGKNWPKAKNALAEGQSPPQELEVSPRSGLYLLVMKYLANFSPATVLTATYIKKINVFDIFYITKIYAILGAQLGGVGEGGSCNSATGF